MSFFQFYKILLDGKENDAEFKELVQKLVEQDETIQNLQKQKDQLQKDCENSAMEVYSLQAIAEEVAYRSQYQETVEKELENLYISSNKLGHLLQSVEWHKIQNYNELQKREEQRALEEKLQISEQLDSRLEKRKIVQKLFEQRTKRDKLNSLLDDAAKTIANEKNIRQSKWNLAIQKRNETIVNLVKGSKELEELRLKISMKNSDKSVDKTKSNELQPKSTTCQPNLSLPRNDLKVDMKNKEELVIEKVNISKPSFALEESSFESFTKLKFTLDSIATTNSLGSSMLREPTSIIKKSGGPSVVKHVQIVVPDDDYASSKDEDECDELPNIEDMMDFDIESEQNNEELYGQAGQTSPPNCSYYVKKTVQSPDEEMNMEPYTEDMMQQMNAKIPIENSPNNSITAENDDKASPIEGFKSPLTKKKRRNSDCDFFGSPQHQSDFDMNFEMSLEKSMETENQLKSSKSKIDNFFSIHSDNSDTKESNNDDVGNCMDDFF